VPPCKNRGQSSQRKFRRNAQHRASASAKSAVDGGFTDCSTRNSGLRCDCDGKESPVRQALSCNCRSVTCRKRSAAIRHPPACPIRKSPAPALFRKSPNGAAAPPPELVPRQLPKKLQTSIGPSCSACGEARAERRKGGCHFFPCKLICYDSILSDKAAHGPKSVKTFRRSPKLALRANNTGSLGAKPVETADFDLDGATSGVHPNSSLNSHGTVTIPDFFARIGPENGKHHLTWFET